VKRAIALLSSVFKKEEEEEEAKEKNKCPA
jgi:hypothetical protein